MLAMLTAVVFWKDSLPYVLFSILTITWLFFAAVAGDEGAGNGCWRVEELQRPGASFAFCMLQAFLFGFWDAEIAFYIRNMIGFPPVPYCS